MNLRCAEFTLKGITCYSKAWNVSSLVKLPQGKSKRKFYGENRKGDCLVILICVGDLLNKVETDLVLV